MLRKLRIRSKLIAIVIVPIVALLALGGLGLRQRTIDGRDAARVRRYGRLVDAVRPLVTALSRERGLSVWTIALAGNGATSSAPASAPSTDDLVKVRTAVDQSAAALGQAARRAGTLPDRLARSLAAAQADVAGLPARREAIDGKNLNADQVATGYVSSIDKLLAFIGDFATERSLGDAAIARLASAVVDIAEIRESYGRIREVVALALASGNVSFEQYGNVRAEIEHIADESGRFRIDANGDAANGLSQLQGGPPTAFANAVETKLVSAGPGTKLEGALADYYASASNRIDTLGSAEDRASSALSDAAAQRAVEATEAQRNYLLATLGALTLALAIAALVARSLIRPVRELTSAATRMANEKLPDLVEQIASTSGPVEPLVDPIAVRSRDEIGELASAFNSVQRVAVTTAVEQAALRRSVGDMFVNLGRRNQSLVNRQLELIDALEGSERNPDVLNDLFALDHLATRMRRNAENLLVLAGEEPPRKWGQAVPLVDVIRAGVSEVEDYTRVDVLAEDELYLAGHAASDVAHLLAELVENATSFSAPTTRVRVRVERGNDKYLVSVIDQGIGMTDADLASANERLADPPEADLTLSNRVGFYVIGRLARRTGTAVRLGRSSANGTIAQLALPPSLVTRTAGEHPAGTAGTSPSGLLGDSPQSARDRLIGALRSQPARTGANADIEPVASVPAPAREVYEWAPEPTVEVAAADDDWTSEPAVEAAPAVAPPPPPQPPAMPLPLPAPTPVPLPSPAAWAPPPGLLTPPSSTISPAVLPKAAPSSIPASPPSSQPVVTSAGLPVRQAGATRRAVPTAAAEDDNGPARNAEEVRSMLARFRGGVERGRNLADTATTDNSSEDQP